MTYADTLQSWRDFYVTAGAAAATLVGLLFVGLSLHIRVVVAHAEVRSLARVTLVDFFVVLLVSLFLLAPIGSGGAAASVIGVGVLSLALIVRQGLEAVRGKRARTIRPRLLLSRFGLSALCYLGIASMGVLLSLGGLNDALAGLLVLVVLLLVVAVRNTWDLLVTVADAPMP
jgi:hypothetical protein